MADLPLTALAVSDYRPTSSGVSPTPSSFQSEDSLLQSEMKTIIGGEIKSATFYVDLTASILPVNYNTVQNVADDLKSTFEHLTDQGKSTATEPRFPQGGFRNEPLSYLPFSHLLNKIIGTANRHLPPSYLTRLRFYPFDKEVKDAFRSRKALKPDGVGILGELPAGKKELPWELIEVPFESKNGLAALVRQSGTYARCCFLSNQRRSFSLVIGFRFTTLEAYVFLFHRSGLSSSRALRLTTREGFEGLVRHIVAILSIQDEAAYGLDPTRFQNMFCINNRHYKVDRLLYVRDSLRGRATIVHSLHGEYT
jgi:protein kinase-like protein